MAMDFPASPTEGQTYQAPGGPLYTYRAPAWRSGVTQPQVAKSWRNRVVNSAMQWSQENAVNSAPVTAVGLWYAADQFYANWNFTGAAFSATRVTNATASPNGNTYAVYTACQTAKATPASGEYWMLGTRIEGYNVSDFKWGTAGARRAIIRFSFSAMLVGTYTLQVMNHDASRAYITPFTVATAGVWATYTVVVPGDTAGVWANETNTGISLRWVLSGQASFTAPTDVWGTNVGYATGQANLAVAAANSCMLTDVGLYLDVNGDGVPPPWETPDPAAELARCQRYWNSLMLYGSTTTPAAVVVFYAHAHFTVPFRVMPTFTGVNGVNSRFSATVGSLTGLAATNGLVNGVVEGRASTGTAGTAAVWSTHVFANARM